MGKAKLSFGLILGAIAPLGFLGVGVLGVNLQPLAARAEVPALPEPADDPPGKKCMLSSAPAYPPSFAGQRVEGSVTVQVEIGPSGNAIDATIVSSSGYRAMDSTALSAAYGLSCSSGPASIKVTFSFALDGSDFEREALQRQAERDRRVVILPEGNQCQASTLPVYPFSLNEWGIEGSATMQVEIDASGNPVDVTVVDSSGYGAIDAAAYAAAYDLRCPPGEPHTVSVTFYFAPDASDFEREELERQEEVERQGEFEGESELEAGG